MKKLLFIILLAALTACNSNSITPPPTLTPIPTPTEIPERTSPFGTDGFIGEGKIGPWVGEANKVEPSQVLLDNVKKLSKDGEALVFEVKDAEGKTGQVVFVLEKDANGHIY